MPDLPELKVSAGRSAALPATLLGGGPVAPAVQAQLLGDVVDQVA